MPILLKIDSSPMGDRSISRKLTARFATTWSKVHPDGTVIARDLTAIDIPVGHWRMGGGSAYTGGCSDAGAEKGAERIGLTDFRFTAGG